MTACVVGVLLRQLRQLDPDVLLVQELCPEIAECVLEALPAHRCVTQADHNHSSCSDQEEGHGEEVFAGWQQEGNIFFRSSLFTLVQWGHEFIGQEEPLRRLFWVRLLPVQHCDFSPDRQDGVNCKSVSNTILFSTAHFTWQGHPKEYDSDINLRKIQARHTTTVLNHLQEERDLACFFGGDLNESFWPKILLERAGFVDCFSALGLPCRPTHPMRPTLAHEDNNADSVLDWMFSRGKLLSRIEVRNGGTNRDDFSGGLGMVQTNFCSL